MEPINKKIEEVLNQAQRSVEHEERFHLGMEFLLFVSASLFMAGFVLDPSKEMSKLDTIAMFLWFFGIVWFVSFGIPILYGIVLDWWRKG